jgi:hypothetical protein
MSSQELVLQSYPYAAIVEIPPVMHSRTFSPVQPGYWIIYAGVALGSLEVGRGSTQEEAWADAAAKLECVATTPDST